MMTTPLTYSLLFCLSLGFRSAASVGKDASSFPDTVFRVYDTGTLREGHTVTLSCHLDSPSAASFIRPSSYVWVKDGKVIPGQTGVTYNVGPLTKQDEGDYQCGDPDSDIPRGKYQLNVFIPSRDMVSKPTVFQSGFPLAGRPFFLDCVIMEGYAANVNTKYTWYKDHTEVKGETGHWLRFSKLTEADEGEYVCTAWEGTVETTSPPSVEYYLKPLVAPQLHMKPAHNDSVVRGVLGENLTLTCEVTRAFPPVPVEGYSWSYLPSNQDQGQPLEEKSSTLTLSPLTRNHSGQYQCQARNDHDFPGMHLTGRASVNVDVVYVENISMTHDLRISEGEPLTLTCIVDSNPTALLTWTVGERVVRHVTYNLDHYFILSTACSDSGTYTCRASNMYLPGQEKGASALVTVICQDDPRRRRTQPGIIYTDESAPFDFLLPSQTAVVIVHPSGQDIVTFFPNCSYAISEAFRSRCLDPHCERADYHVSFTLINLTEKDEGDYTCLDLGKQRQRIPSCSRKLIINREETNDTHVGVWQIMAAILAVLLAAIIINVTLIAKRGSSGCRLVKILRPLRGRPMIELVPLTSCVTPSAETRMNEGSHSFERLYKNGRVYLFPKFVLSQQSSMDFSRKQAAEVTPMLYHDDIASLDEDVFKAKDQIRYVLQQSTGDNNLPCYFLHNTRLSRQANVGLILSRKLGVVVMAFTAEDDEEHLDSLEKVTTHLLEARNAVRDKLKGLVKPEAITVAMVLPNLPHADMDELGTRVKIFNPGFHVELLLGRNKENFKQWSERLSSRPDSQVWDFRTPGADNPDSAFKMAASKFLTLVGSLRPEESPKRPTAAETWLLTPAQMEVRDSTARLLHVWGPPGSGKTTLLIHRARQWLADDKAVILAVGREVYDVLLAYVVKGVLRDQKEETRERIRICHMHTALEVIVKELRGQCPNVEICLIIDTLREVVIFKEMLNVVKSKQVSSAWTVCRDKLKAVDTELSKTAKGLGWESVKLPESIRCTEDTAKLLNQLGQGNPHYCPVIAATVPRDRDIPEFCVVDHSQHRDPHSTTSTCVQCKTELSRVLPISDENPHWNDWVALCTGNPNVLTDLKPLCVTLKELGVPASIDKYSDVVASHGSRLDSSEQDVAKWLERAMNGVDERGKPTVHLVRVRDLAGVEKEGILLVHWDERDFDSNDESKEDKDTRLADHRHLWTLAVSRCRSQVVLLLLTPSPARSLLD